MPVSMNAGGELLAGTELCEGREDLQRLCSQRFDRKELRPSTWKAYYFAEYGFSERFRRKILLLQGKVKSNTQKYLFWFEYCYSEHAC